MGIIDIITISMAATCLFVSLLTAGLCAFCLIEYKSFKKSTHSIQYVPVEPGDSGLSEKQMNDFDSNPYEEEL